MDKWTVKVKSEDFTERIWQHKDTFSGEELTQVLEEWAKKVQAIVNCLADEKTTDEMLDELGGDYYPLGDLVNFLVNIEIAVEEKRGKWIKDKPYYNSYNAFIEPVHCSECNWHEYEPTKYCPNCGIEMEAE